MNSDFTDALSKAKALLSKTRHAAMATVNEDNSPHNTPFFFLYEPDLSKIYWGSHPDSLHTLNVERTGNVFVALYDSKSPKQGGLYLKGENAHELSGEELEQALKVHNSFRNKEGKPDLPISYYQDKSPQRMYGTDITKSWILMSENNKDGLRIKDYRKEINPSELFS